MTDTTLPLLAFADADSPFARHDNRPISRGEFLAAVVHLANRLPERRYVFNTCENRYCFTVGFAAACVRGQTTLMPPNRTAALLADLRAQHEDNHEIDDDFVAKSLSARSHRSVPAISQNHLAAIVFTSGSTGAPQANNKLWRTLVGVARQEKDRLFPDGAHVIATVPSQHMYGFETTTLLALGSNCAMHESKSLFPGDIRAALGEVDGPRVLVTTPWHLQVCLRSGLTPPPIARVISATAPLDKELALEIESRWSTEVHEIYGCTEAGSMASRRTAVADLWHAYDGGRYSQEQGVNYYGGTHLPGAVPLQDRLELVDAEHVRLIGRATDIVKVGGKRASLDELTRQILTIDGVIDAAIYQPQVDQRIAACVVAPNTSQQFLLDKLSTRFDPVFMPRPLLLVDSLPRNDVGKLTRESLRKLFETHKSPKP